jgi:hypothetical protein
MGRGRWETPANYVTVHHEDNPTGQPYREEGDGSLADVEGIATAR